jgi:predicted 2-oxoglutarate/Fe(II)-dependent dioxygenase YbiX
MIKDEIFLIENLIDIDYLSSLNNWLGASKPNRREGQKSTLGTYNIPSSLHEGFQDLYFKSKEEIEKFYSVSLYDEQFNNVIEYKAGDILELHTDNLEYLDGELSYNASTSSGHLRQISSVLYLNNTYTGGEIDFPNLSIRIKPKAGTLIAFPSADQSFLHQVLEITSGEKWIAPCFWSIKD